MFVFCLVNIIYNTLFLGYQVVIGYRNKIYCQERKKMNQQEKIEVRLRSLIISGELKLGAFITERWAEKLFSTSRTPVRAAFINLQAEGLICRQGKRWVIPFLNKKEISDLFDFREELEIASLRLAIINKGMDNVALHYYKILQNNFSVTSHNDIIAGNEFHMILTDLSENEIIKAQLKLTLQRLTLARWYDNINNHIGWEEHNRIAGLLSTGKFKEAEDEIRLHVTSSKKRIIKAFNEKGI